MIEKFDVALPAMTAALKEFGDRTGNADWAGIYFSGHGIKMNGNSYLVPTDAKLERDTHIAEETIPLERLREKADGARKLRLVILDACRSNPFATSMVHSAGSTRSIGPGLAPVEPAGAFSSLMPPSTAPPRSTARGQTVPTQ